MSSATELLLTGKVAAYVAKLARAASMVQRTGLGAILPLFDSPAGWPVISKHDRFALQSEVRELGRQLPRTCWKRSYSEGRILQSTS